MLAEGLPVNQGAINRIVHELISEDRAAASLPPTGDPERDKDRWTYQRERVRRKIRVLAENFRQRARALIATGEIDIAFAPPAIVLGMIREIASNPENSDEIRDLMKRVATDLGAAYGRDVAAPTITKAKRELTLVERNKRKNLTPIESAPPEICWMLLEWSAYASGNAEASYSWATTTRAKKYVYTKGRGARRGSSPRSDAAKGWLKRLLGNDPRCLTLDELEICKSRAALHPNFKQRAPSDS